MKRKNRTLSFVYFAMRLLWSVIIAFVMILSSFSLWLCWCSNHLTILCFSTFVNAGYCSVLLLFVCMHVVVPSYDYANAFWYSCTLEECAVQINKQCSLPTVKTICTNPNNKHSFGILSDNVQIERSCNLVAYMHMHVGLIISPDMSCQSV